MNELKHKIKTQTAKCAECGSKNNLTVDHVIPVSRGGTNHPANLQILCEKCNGRKSNRLKFKLFKRLEMALHVDEFVNNLRNEVKGWVAGSQTSAVNRILLENNNLKSLIGNQNIKMEKLIQRIKMMEEYHKIQYVEETTTFFGYKKITKKK